jgi:Ca2+-binding RTX toxin-like protein
MSIRLWGTEKLVNTTTVNGQGTPVVTGLANGGYVIAWNDDMGSGSSVIKFQRFDALGNKTGVEKTVASDGGGEQDQVSICTLSNGSFVIAHRDADPELGPQASTITLTRYEADGTQIGQTSYGSVFTGSTSQPSVRAEGTGFRLSATQLVGSQADVYTSHFDVNGVQLSNTAIDSSTNLAASPEVVETASGLTAIFTKFIGTTDAQITLRTGDASGNFTGTSKILTVIGVLSLDDYIFETHIDSIGQFTDPFVVNYTITSKITGESDFHASLVTGDGTLVADLATGPGSFPEILLQADQTFFLVFQRTGATSSEIVLQHYNNAGMRLGVEIIANTHETGDGQRPTIAQLSDGRFIITWTDASSGSDGSSTAVKQHIFDPRDGVVNGSNDATVAETLVGHDALGDVMRGFAGNDTIYGLAGADVIYGGAGEDYIDGGRGDDTIYGDTHADKLSGGIGNDEIYGGSGDDTLYLGSGEDFGDGGTGFNTLSYYARTQGAIVDMADQTLNAGSATDDTFINIDRINGSDAGADTLSGDANNNYLVGYGGIDKLNGNSGDDTLRGGAGADILSGGTGADKFRYEAVNEGGDSISSFSSLDDFQFVRTAFGNLTGANVGASAFLSRASGSAATTTSHRFVFDQSTETLWYDSNGNVAGGLTKIATIGVDTALSNTDLLLV